MPSEFSISQPLFLNFENDIKLIYTKIYLRVYMKAISKVKSTIQILDITIIVKDICILMTC